MLKQCARGENNISSCLVFCENRKFLIWNLSVLISLVFKRCFWMKAIKQSQVVCFSWLQIILFTIIYPQVTIGTYRKFSIIPVYFLTTTPTPFHRQQHIWHPNTDHQTPNSDPSFCPQPSPLRTYPALTVWLFITLSWNKG